MPTEKHAKCQGRELVKLSVSELKHILRSFGRKTKGRKSALISRIQEHQQQQEQRRLQLSSSGTMAKAKKSQNAEASSLRQRNSSTNGIHTSPSEVAFHKMTDTLEMERNDRAKIVLWRQPLTTLQYFVQEGAVLLKTLATRLYRRKRAVALTILLLCIAFAIYHMDGPHQKFVEAVEKEFLWSAYWVGLGILSSVGLGTGLHTFILYLGPHIAAVTLAAYECKSVNFPEPPYPNEILCPKEQEEGMSLWTIMSKVRLEAVMWGAGTAIGELPPYFMARAARLSGVDLEDDDFEELEELIHDKKRHPEEIGFVERAKLSVHNLVQRVGFFGILACASIPNPLFDLAGITCGHFLIPFWTFFGATLIGKAIIKMHIQKLFVIFMFSAHHVEQVVHLIGKIPHYGLQLQKPFREYLEHQKTKLHHKLGEGAAEEGGSVLSWLFEKLVLIMVVYFILSILNSMAQNYHKRMCKLKRASTKKEEK